MLATLIESEFDSLLKLAAYACQAPICLLSLLNEERSGNEVAIGLDSKLLEKSRSFSQHTLHSAAFVEISDALENPLFVHHPFVTGGPHIRFYAGIALINAEGAPLGTLNLFDTMPRQMEQEQRHVLKVVAEQLVAKLEMSKQNATTCLSERCTQAIAQASAQLLRITDATRAIESALASVGGALSVSSIRVYEKDPQDGKSGFCQQYQWLPDEKKGHINAAYPKEVSYAESDLAPWYHQLELGTSLQGLGQALWVTEKPTLTRREADSLLIPIFIADHFWGFIYVTVPVKAWTAIEQDCFTTLANMLGSVLAKKQAEEALIKASKALMKEQNLMQSLMDHAPDSIYLKDTQSRFIRMSKCLLSKIGIKDHSQTVGKTDFDYFLPEHAHKAFDMEQEIIKTGISLVNFEEKETWTDGRITWVSTTKMPLYNEEGEIVGTLGISRDITASKTSEIELINSRNYLNHIFETVPIPIFVKDRYHRWTFLNEAWCQFSKVDKNEYIGKSDFDLHSPKDGEIFWQRDEVVFKTGDPVIHEEVLTNQDGQVRTVITKKTRFRDEYGKDFLVGTLIDITEIKNYQTQLLEYKNYLDTILNTLADPIFVKDRNHRLILVNEAFCKAAGQSREALLNKTDATFHTPEKTDMYYQQDEVVFQTKQPLIIEDTFFSDEQVQKTTITKKTHFSNKLNEDFLVGSVTDITDLKKTELAIIAKEKYYRSLILNSTDIISVLEKDATTRYHSPSFYQILGYSDTDTIIGHSVFEYIHPDDIAAVVDTFKQILQKPGGSMIVEHRFKKANGEWAVMESVGTNQLDDEAVAGVVVNSRDVTDRKKVEAEIQDKSQILNGITANMPVIVFKTDKQGFFTESIGAGVKRLQLTENQVVGMSIYDAFPQVKDNIIGAFQQGFTSFITSSTSGPEWHFETYIFEDKAPTGGLIGFALDITANKISEQQRQEYALDLEKTNKELDQFAYIISHDLKAPLRAIANLSQWIEEDLGSAISDDVSSNMKLLRSRVDRMQALIKGVLDYSRVTRTKAEQGEVDVEALLNDMLPMLEIPASHPVIVKTPLPIVLTNRTRLEQVFSNLISNAIKYHDKPHGTIRISYQETPTFHQFSISDDGPGIAPEYHEKIFAIFQTLQARDKVESTGVGLAIVKKIIDDKGGRIWLESQLGQGTTFYFTLPKKSKTSFNNNDNDG